MSYYNYSYAALRSFCGDIPALHPKFDDAADLICTTSQVNQF
jgi:hypothetical protein